MKTIYHFTLFIALLCIRTNTYAQVSALMYQLEYSTFDSSYTVYIKIIIGSAIDPKQRAQYNSQISLVLPAGTDLAIQKMHMPLQNNSKYEGTSPLRWEIASTVTSPSSDAKHDFISITPILSPISFYNDLNPNDEVKLFTFKVSKTPSDPTAVRFYDNNIDPNSSAAGMGGGDFTNHFTIGDIKEDYTGNLPLRIINATTVINETSILSDTKIFPNPFTQSFTIDSKSAINDYRIIDINGQTVHRDNQSEVDFSNFNTGIYFIELTAGKNKNVKKIVKL
jgi:hypothetical protein